MKRIILLLLVLALCVSLAACGGNQSTGNPDHDYVIALMEKGDYDMAITVLEHLRDESGTAAPDRTEGDTVPDQTEEPEQVEVPAPATPTSIQQLVVDTVRQFMADKGDAMVKKFKEYSGTPAREPVVINAMEYRLDNCDGNGSNAHYLLIALETDIYDGSGFADRLQLLLDMDTQAVYNSAEINWDLLASGEPTNKEEFNTFLLNSYFSYLLYGADQVWTQMEIREELTEADITAINKALW